MASSNTSKKTASTTAAASDRDAQTDVVTLKAMRFHARIGVLPHEAEIAQSIEVDASLWVRRGGAKPTTKDIVDYRRVYDLVADIVTRGHINFLEEVGERIAERALQVPLVERVRIAVRKPNVALPGPLAYAEVALERERA
ncbi:MAG TPA: dihydroneopterin aldolase [Gemmatimonadaceae bacterium]|nr:dihydroneopterin aldolase [Gemmatimonadaceae bacterium]